MGSLTVAGPVQSDPRDSPFDPRNRAFRYWLMGETPMDLVSQESSRLIANDSWRWLDIAQGNKNSMGSTAAIAANHSNQLYLQFVGNSTLGSWLGNPAFHDADAVELGTTDDVTSPWISSIVSDSLNTFVVVQSGSSTPWGGDLFSSSAYSKLIGVRKELSLDRSDSSVLTQRGRSSSSVFIGSIVENGRNVKPTISTWVDGSDHRIHWVPLVIARP